MTTGLLSKEQSLAARALCRRVDAEVHFASHFLPAERRGELYAVAALVEQLRDILTPGITPGVAPGSAPGSAPGTTPCTDASASASACASDPTKAPESCTSAGPSGCSTCGGETPEQRRHVCSMVLEFLYGGEKTGKPELDGFHAVAQARGLRRDLFESCADGLTTLIHTKRIPTWKRQREAMDRAAGSLGVVALLLAGSGDEVVASVEPQVRAWGVGIYLARSLPRAGAVLLAGRVPVPLDDVFKAGLSEADLHDMAQRGTHGDDPRWAALMQGQCERAASLMSGGEASLPRVGGAFARAAAVLGQIERGRLDDFAKRGYPIMPHETSRGLWSRLSKLPRAMRVLGRAR